MINPNALPTSSTVQDFQNLESALDSSDYNDTLQAMQYMRRQPTGGLNRLPQVTVPMQEGGMMEEAIMEKQDMEPEEAMLMEQVEQQDPRQPNPEAMAMAQQVASYGRGGDKLILHVRPDELQGLASMLTITINPETGMPEAFLKGLRRAVSSVTKPIRNVVKSDAFKTIAPIALAIAAPMVLPSLSPIFASGGMFAGSTALGAGVQAGLGSLAGNLLAGRKFGDAAKAALITGATAGTMKGISNIRGGKTFFGGVDKTPPPVAEGTYQAAGMELVPTEGIPQAFPEGQTTVPRELKMERGFTDEGIDLGTGTYTDVVKPSPEPIKTTIVEETIKKPTFTSRLGDAKTALIQGVKERYTPDLGGLTRLTGDVLKGDIGASVVESQNMAEQAEQQAENELADMGYTFSGFGDQRVITDPSGVTLPATLTAQQILSRALGGGRFQFAERTAFEPVVAAQGGLISMANGGSMKTEDDLIIETFNDYRRNKSTEEVMELFGPEGGYRRELERALKNKGLNINDLLSPTKKAQGGLIELAQGGEFSGPVPGNGGGMDDNVYMPIKQGREQVGTLAVSPTEYVVDSYTMAALGDGNPDEGAKVMDKTIKEIRQKAYGTTKQPSEIDGLQALRPMVQGV